MSFSNTFAYAVARAVDVATASVFTKETDCTISSLCDVALETGGSPFLQRLGRVLNWIQPAKPATATAPATPYHTREARLSDIAKAQAIINYLTLPAKPS
jgi:hypothetical protein